MATPATDEHPAGSLTEWLRARTDDQLAELLRRRPDLALPAPADIAMLASRLSVRTSVQRAIDGLDAFRLRVLEALVISADGEITDPKAAQELLGDIDGAVFEDAVTALTTLGLLWGDDSRLVPMVRESLGGYPGGLGRPAATLFRFVSDVQLAPVLRALGLPPAAQPQAGASVAEVYSDPARIDELITASDAAEREVLERLAAGPPIGTVRHAQVSLRTSGDAELPPALRLLGRGLLVAIDAQTVELPREVALALRPVPLGTVAVEPPPIEVQVRPPADLDSTGTTAVLEVLRLVTALAESWTAQPPAVLRSGGLGVRDLRRTARELAVEEPTVALLAEVAYAAGLIASTQGLEPVYLATPDYDTWLRHTPERRWADLAGAWLAMSRQPSLVGQRGDRDRVITALGQDVERGTAPALRAHVLDVLLALEPGGAPTDRAGVLANLAWHTPRRAAAQRAATEAVLAEADILGFTAAGGLTGYSRTLLAGSRTAAEQALANAMPAPVDHIVVQPDLTIIVPGPPEPALAAELGLAADLESSGGASVYRITERSVRRALDAGRSAAMLRAMLTERSRTPLPQSLTYLIDDAGRRHGVLRAGVASAYLRCDDDALLTRVLADRHVDSLHLRRIAPSVVISSAPVNRVLEVLRAAGYAPAAEAPDGQVVALGADPARAPSRTPVRIIRPRTTLDSRGDLDELVRRIRSGDTLSELTRRAQPLVQNIPGVTSATTMALLRQAIREGRRILLGHAEPDGTATRHTILPISMGGGYVRGHESETQRLQSYSLHRLTAVTMLDDDPADDPATTTATTTSADDGTATSRTDPIRAARQGCPSATHRAPR